MKFTLRTNPFLLKKSMKILYCSLIQEIFLFYNVFLFCLINNKKKFGNFPFNIPDCVAYTDDYLLVVKAPEDVLCQLRRFPYVGEIKRKYTDNFLLFTNLLTYSSGEKIENLLDLIDEKVLLEKSKGFFISKKIAFTPFKFNLTFLSRRLKIAVVYAIGIQKRTFDLSVANIFYNVFYFKVKDLDYEKRRESFVKDLETEIKLGPLTSNRKVAILEKMEDFKRERLKVLKFCAETLDENFHMSENKYMECDVF